MLPTEKRTPRAGVGKAWVYGDAGVGKSTTVAEMDPDHTLVMDTEGSTTALEAFVVDVRSWEDFRRYGQQLAAGDHAYTMVQVDTVDVLAKLCADSVLRGLAGLPEGSDKFVHASDFEWGKGWSAITEEFSLRIAKLCHVIPNVVFVSHAATDTVKSRTGAERTVAKPDLAPKGVRTWLEGFVDHIAYAEIIPAGDGLERVLRMRPSPDYLAKSRVPRGVEPPSDPLPMNGPGFRAALEGLTAGPRAVAAEEQAAPADAGARTGRSRSGAKKAA